MNIADAVGTTLCRPVRRGSVIDNQPVVCSRKFYFHTENTEFTEAHLLRVLALRNICATMYAEWFCEFCEVCVKLNSFPREIQIRSHETVLRGWHAARIARNMNDGCLNAPRNCVGLRYESLKNGVVNCKI